MAFKRFEPTVEFHDPESLWLIHFKRDRKDHIGFKLILNTEGNRRIIVFAAPTVRDLAHAYSQAKKEFREGTYIFTDLSMPNRGGDLLREVKELEMESEK